MKNKPIEFSKDGKGSILTSSYANSLCLYKINDPNIKVGDVTNLDTKNLELLAELKFYKTESIDSMITQLNKIKENIIRLSAC